MQHVVKLPIGPFTWTIYNYAIFIQCIRSYTHTHKHTKYKVNNNTNRNKKVIQTLHSVSHYLPLCNYSLTVKIPFHFLLNQPIPFFVPLILNSFSLPTPYSTHSFYPLPIQLILFTHSLFNSFFLPTPYSTHSFYPLPIQLILFTHSLFNSFFLPTPYSTHSFLIYLMPAPPTDHSNNSQIVHTKIKYTVLVI